MFNRIVTNLNLVEILTRHGKDKKFQMVLTSGINWLIPASLDQDFNQDFEKNGIYC